MQTLRDSVWRFVSSAALLGSPEALDDAFSRVIGQVAFSRFDSRLLTRYPSGPTVRVLSDCGLGAWNDHYNRQGLVNQDPCMEYGRSGDHGMRPAFTWSDVRDQMPLGSGDPIWSEARSGGMREAFVVSTRVAANDFLVVRMVGEESDFDPEARPVLNALAVLYGALQHQLAKPPAPAAPALTARERQCLVWVAQGKSDTDIGVILGMSRHTVQTHVEKAKTKLGVASRVQAAFEAHKRGELAIP